MTDRKRATPTRQAREAANTQRRLLLRLIRQLLHGPCRTAPVAGGIEVTGHESRVYPEALLREAQSLGLAVRTSGMITATHAAAGYLRRALVEGEDAFGDQHRELVETVVEVEAVRQPVRRNLNESPLGAIARLKDRDGQPFLPAEAVDAGERLLADFTRGQLQPRVTASWEPRLAGKGEGRRSAGGQEIADSAMAARLRFSRAMDGMGPELAGVAVDVCCFSKGLELVERERQWPARSAKLMLRTALLSLARHYAPPPPVRDPRRTHHWGAEDYRPEL
jgi:hypothetical protein